MEGGQRVRVLNSAGKVGKADREGADRGKEVQRQVVETVDQMEQTAELAVIEVAMDRAPRQKRSQAMKSRFPPTQCSSSEQVVVVVHFHLLLQ